LRHEFLGWYGSISVLDQVNENIERARVDLEGAAAASEGPSI
jgi:hypothetical protein